MTCTDTSAVVELLCYPSAPFYLSLAGRFVRLDSLAIAEAADVTVVGLSGKLTLHSMQWPRAGRPGKQRLAISPSLATQANGGVALGTNCYKAVSG